MSTERQMSCVDAIRQLMSAAGAAEIRQHRHSVAAWHCSARRAHARCPCRLGDGGWGGGGGRRRALGAVYVRLGAARRRRHPPRFHAERKSPVPSSPALFHVVQMIACNLIGLPAQRWWQVVVASAAEWWRRELYSIAASREGRSMVALKVTVPALSSGGSGVVWGGGAVVV